jgi:hypothetical protein
VIAVEEGVGTPNPFKRYYGGGGMPSRILKAGTHPLPYVQVGMKLRIVGRSWQEFASLVQEVYATPSGMRVRLVGANTGRAWTMPYDEVRRGYDLMADFETKVPSSDSPPSCLHAKKEAVPSYYDDTQWCPDCGAVRGNNGCMGAAFEWLDWQLPKNAVTPAEEKPQ